MSEINIPVTFTLDDLLAAIGQSDDVEGFQTVAEWCDRLHTWDGRMRKLMKEAKRRGLLEVKRAMRPALDDSMRWTNVYRFRIEKEDS
jgi:hypothetical protein